MWSALAHGLLEMLYPRRCAACARPLRDDTTADGLVCRQCWETIGFVAPPLCCRCGRHRTPGARSRWCPSCMRATLHFDRAAAPCRFEGTIQELIHRLKYRGHVKLALPLSTLMARHIVTHGLPIDHFDMIMPIPLHTARLRERGFNQAHALAQPLARAFAKPLADGILRRHRATRTQTDLAPAERIANVAGSFSVTAPAVVHGKHILLVEDVYTTGATCSAAACALKSAGAGIVQAITLAN